MSLKENKIFHQMLSSYILSIFGSSFFTIAINLFVLQTTKSAKAMSIIFVTQVVVSVLFGSFAGTVVDKYSRKNIIWISEYVRTILLLLMVFLFSFHHISFYLIVVLCSLITFISLFHMPAYMASLTDVTGIDNVEKTTAINNIGDNVARILGLALGGGFIGLFGGEGAILFNAVTSLLSGLIMMLIKNFPTPNVEQAKHEKKSFSKDFKEGLIFVWEHPLARSALFFIPILFSFFSSCLMLIQVIAVKNWHARGWEYGLIEAFIPLGYILGTIFIFKRDKNMKKRGRFVSFGIIMLGFLYFLLSFSSSNIVYLPLILCIGFVFCFPSLLLYIIGRIEIDSAMQGRAFGTIGSISSVLPAVLVALSSFYADEFGGLVVLRYNGLILIFISVILIYLLKNIRQYD
jgi:MFS family permease